MYDQGFGVPKDYKEAVKWYRRRPSRVLLMLSVTLDICTTKAFGVPKNYKEAIKWFTKAAEQGDADAQCNLG